MWRKIYIVFFFWLLSCQLYGQQLWNVLTIDTLDAFTVQVSNKGDDPLFYTKDWDYSKWQKLEDSTQFSIPTLLHFNTVPDSTGMECYNFPSQLQSGWQATIWEDEHFIYAEMLNAVTRQHFEFSKDTIAKHALWDQLVVEKEQLPENQIYLFDGVEPLGSQSNEAVSKIFAGNLLYVSGMQDFRPVPLIVTEQTSQELMLLWEAEFGEFEPQEGDLHSTGDQKLIKSYTGALESFFGWSFSGFKTDTLYDNINGRFIWGNPVFQMEEETPQKFMILYQVMSNKTHQELAQQMLEREWKAHLDWYTMYGGSSYKNWALYFDDWKKNWKDQHYYKYEHIRELNDSAKITIHRFRGEEGSIFIQGILSDTMYYEIDLIKNIPVEVAAIPKKNFEFNQWLTLEEKSEFTYAANQNISLTPVFDPTNVRNYRKIKTLQSKNVFKELTDSFPKGYLILLLLILGIISLIIFRA